MARQRRESRDGKGVEAARGKDDRVVASLLVQRLDYTVFFLLCSPLLQRNQHLSIVLLPLPKHHNSFVPFSKRTYPIVPLTLRICLYRNILYRFPDLIRLFPSPHPLNKQKTYQTMDSLLSANKPTKGTVDDLASSALEFNLSLHHLHIARQTPSSTFTSTTAATGKTTSSGSSTSQQQKESLGSSSGGKGAILQR